MFINPIEILDLQHTEAGTIDVNVIKKAKRKLFADIDLSDHGYLEYKGQQLSRTDCEKVVDELDSNEKKEFYIYIAGNRLLNDFLANGDEQLFRSFTQEDISKVKDFIPFISPYYAERFDKCLLNGYRSNNTDLLRSMLATQALIHASHADTAFKSLTNEIQSKITEVEDITERIDSGRAQYNNENIDGLTRLVRAYFPAELINLLPAYFQSQVNRIADAVNFLTLAIYDKLEITDVPVTLLEHILKLNIGSVSKPTFERNYEIIKKRHDDKVEQEKNAPVMKHWEAVLKSIENDIESVDNEKLDTSQASSNVLALFIVKDLNALPSYADTLRTQIAFSVRSLGISCWNKKNDIRSAFVLLEKTLMITVSAEVKERFKQDLADLERLEKEGRGVITCYFCDKNPPDDGCGIKKTIYKVIERGYWDNSVKFSYIPVTLPRCKSCKQVHEQRNKTVIKWVIGMGFAGFLVDAFAEGYMIFGAAAGAFIGWGISKLREEVNTSYSDVLDTGNATLADHPLIAEKMREGYSFNRPSA